MIRNHRPPMQYRRFGRTGKMLSVITLGGMRYVHGWESPRDQVPADTLAECVTMTQMALDAGINHIETAHGYGKSEYCYGLVLNRELRVPRERYHLMTKGCPTTRDDVRRLIDEQLRGLQTDHIDLYAWHGINHRGILEATLKGGAIEELHRLKAEGVIGDVGFSTHGPLDVVMDALATGLFNFVNLHYYYFYQRLAGAVAYAAAKDIGVFIISPNDKGGQLYNPSPLVRELCAPLTPIQWNARWCLRSPAVQTLTFGLTRPEHVREALGVMPVSMPLTANELATQVALDGRISQDPAGAWEGWECIGDPSGINIPEVLRFRRLWKCFDMRSFAEFRYNMLESKGHWFPGCFATDEAISQVDTSRVPPGIDLKALLRETHAALYKTKS
jgi:hypothetical protein